MEVYVDDEAKLTLHGLQQHYVKLKDSEKNRKLFELLDVLEFNQVVIFVKSVQRCMALAQLLIEQNFPAIAIHRGMTQEERLSRYQSFKDFQKVSLSFYWDFCYDRLSQQILVKITILLCEIGFFRQIEVKACWDALQIVHEYSGLGTKIALP